MLRKHLFSLGLLAIAGWPRPPRPSTSTATPIAAAARNGSATCGKWLHGQRSRRAEHERGQAAPGRSPTSCVLPYRVINGKFVEGHVPAEQIRLLAKRNDLKGIAVPGMPMGSPGMEMGDHKDAYRSSA